MELSRTKPLLRGVSHQIAVVFAIAGCVVMLGRAPSARATAVALVYGLSLVALFGISALYHRPTWSPQAMLWLRRLDHSSIFVFIAGSYTAMCALITGTTGTVLRTLVWVAAFGGILRAVVWPRAPRWLASSLYVLFGWTLVPLLWVLWPTLGSAGVALVCGGGLFYTAGAIVWALRWPDPAPRVFGFHEVFHLLVIGGSALHFAVVVRIVASLA